MEPAPLHGYQREELTWGGGSPFTWVSPYVIQPCFLITCVGTSSMPAKAGAVEMVKADYARTATERNADQAVSKEPVLSDLTEYCDLFSDD